MSRRPALITETDLARVIRVAQKTGVGPVRVLPDGTILIDVKPQPKQDDPETDNPWNSV